MISQLHNKSPTKFCKSLPQEIIADSRPCSKISIEQAASENNPMEPGIPFHIYLVAYASMLVCKLSFGSMQASRP